jgi:hypothetical protein
MQKKKFLIFAILIALCVGMGFAGCSEDTLDSLEGTTWVYSEPDATVTLEFKSEGKGVYTWEEIDGKQKESGHSGFTYTYEHPNVSIDVYGEIMSGVVSGNKMTFTNEEWYGDKTIVFKRK